MCGMEAIERVMQAAGLKTQVELADRLGVSAMAVSYWRTRGVPLKRVPELVAIAGGKVTAHDLAPDFFDPPGDAAA